jgi:uncharacterized membrane protein
MRRMCKWEEVVCKWEGVTARVVGARGGRMVGKSIRGRIEAACREDLAAIPTHPRAPAHVFDPP